ncbi:hypothetical protein ACO0K2_17865 [Undibacterium sp. MH2W]|uniref:hypothetical protein n=1 Tax=Undibacterium sp. MH2W TaxID=3413044 RepID=UPI003BF16091
MNVETQEIDEKKACTCLFLAEDLTAIVASQSEEIAILKEISVRQVEIIFKNNRLLEDKDDLIERMKDLMKSKDDLIERLNIDLAAERGKLHGF